MKGLTNNREPSCGSPSIETLEGARAGYLKQILGNLKKTGRSDQKARH